MVAWGQTVSAVVALDALGGIPRGDGDGHAALLVGGGAELELAVHVVDEGGLTGRLSPSILPTGIEDGP